MSLTINPNMMATYTTNETSDASNSAATASQDASSGLRQIQRAEIKSLSPDSGQAAASAPEQQTGSIVNTTDLRSRITEGLSGLIDAHVGQANMESQGRISSLMDMGSNQNLRTKMQGMELFGNSSLDDVSGGADKLRAMQENLQSGNQIMLDSVARNASMVNSLFKKSG